jgi:hypothetical protein
MSIVCAVAPVARRSNPNPLIVTPEWMLPTRLASNTWKRSVVDVLVLVELVVLLVVVLAAQSTVTVVVPLATQAANALPGLPASAARMPPAKAVPANRTRRRAPPTCAVLATLQQQRIRNLPQVSGHSAGS